MENDIRRYVEKLRDNGHSKGAVHDHLLAPRANKSLPLASYKWNDIDNIIQATHDEITRAYNDASLHAVQSTIPARKTSSTSAIRGTGEVLGISSAANLWADYIRRSQSTDTHIQLDLSKFISSFSNRVRPLVSGDLLLILADTGVGKSSVLQNIALSNIIPTLFFEIELSGHVVAERFQAISLKTPAWKIERDAVNNEASGDTSAWDHVFVCTESMLTIEGIEDRIEKSEEVMGCRPALVMIDYIGLVQGSGGSRYEKASAVAEYMRVLAKKTDTIICIASQIHRPFKTNGRDSDSNVGLHSAKDSGSLENSASLVLGLSRPSQHQMKIEVLKDTRGTAGWHVMTKYIGDQLRIEEMDWDENDGKKEDNDEEF